MSAPTPPAAASSIAGSEVVTSPAAEKGAAPVATERLSLYETLKLDLAVNSHRRGLLGMAMSLLFSPSFATVARFRIVGRLYARGGLGRLVARLMWHGGVRASACHLHWNAVIGPGLALPHPTGIVVGAGVTVGRNATLYQHVTLGTDRFQGECYPVVGNDVVIYTGAVVAGAITIGNGAVIGAHAIAGEDVPAGARLTRKGLRLPARPGDPTLVPAAE